MAAPFVVEGATPGTQVWSVDASGNTVQSGNIIASGTITGAVLNAGTQGATAYSGIQTYLANAGDNTSAAAVYLNGTIGAGGNAILGTAATGTQLSDTTRDYMVYLTSVGGSAGATLRVWELNPDMISIAREVKVVTPPRASSPNPPLAPKPPPARWAIPAQAWTPRPPPIRWLTPPRTSP